MLSIYIRTYLPEGLPDALSNNIYFSIDACLVILIEITRIHHIHQKQGFGSMSDQMSSHT